MPPDWALVAHMEGLGLERQLITDELQASERMLLDSLIAQFQGEPPAPSA